ncbi:transcriptional regulator, GntR family protein [Oceanicola granulosus HTCC2516]|uniref:Transcriptional regulator, GntR family protein n=1 Tax=Oceanicola granulosus (strain ATCC BAA-861 / DSM 15982 / KCTC 12143 / HTCC2516) TaxID=314256 RepID=Q2CFD3_OCEGH|nr:GntR family transcriptional regulator [Oceanicola granulosus]EAR51362.1 transcriptional regulator, GntR family protein [Oceanicola granulosus HTCC2516]
MDGATDPGFFAPALWHRPGRGPRYQQLHDHIAAAIRDGRLADGAQLPPERELAELAQVSRVTVRRAITKLVAAGQVDQRRGAGSFVRRGSVKLEHTLSTLTSFTEYMRARGLTSTSQVLARGLFPPAPDETVALGLATSARVARIERLRSADGVPMALERSSLPADILPDPDLVDLSLYTVLRAAGTAPHRALQRISAVNLAAREAERMALPEGAAALLIERTGYLASGRPIEFTRGLYRPDIYDFVAELRLEDT